MQIFSKLKATAGFVTPVVFAVILSTELLGMYSAYEYSRYYQAEIQAAADDEEYRQRIIELIDSGQLILGVYPEELDSSNPVADPHRDKIDNDDGETDIPDDEIKSHHYHLVYVEGLSQVP